MSAFGTLARKVHWSSFVMLLWAVGFYGCAIPNVQSIWSGAWVPSIPNVKPLRPLWGGGFWWGPLVLPVAGG
eukprot:7080181-Karenia_brevis.AAC.1